MKKRVFALMLVLALLLPMVGAVWAAEDTAPVKPTVEAGRRVPLGCGEEPEYNGYIVKLKDDVMVTFSAESDADYLGFGMWSVDSLEEVEALERAGVLEGYQPDYPMYLLDTDPKFYDQYQWHLKPGNGINGHYAWDPPMSLTGAGVTVAVVDSGIISAHYDLSYYWDLANSVPVGGTVILPGYNAMDDTTDVTDEAGHGTMVSGIIAAQGHAMYGVAKGVKIFPIKVFQGETTATSIIVKGINYVVEQKLSAASNAVKADILNLSLGGKQKQYGYAGGKYCDVLEYAVNAAIDAGIIVIAAVGNDAASTINYPAGYRDVIGVGATGQVDSLATFNLEDESKWAQYSNYNDSVWVTAPGTSILSLDKENPVGYVSSSGTSFATPCVAGMAALALQYADRLGQTLTHAQFKELLRLTAQDKGDPGYDYYYGYGTVDTLHMLTGMEKKDISYVLEGGSLASNAARQYVPYYSEAVTLPIPTKADHFFGGWYLNASCTGERVESFIPTSYAIDTAPVFYAKWIENVTDLEAVSLEGYAAETTDGDHWTAYLPAGTAFPGADAQVEVVYDYSGTQFDLSHTVTYAPPASPGASPTWTIAVTQAQASTQDAGSGGAMTDTYDLTADNTTYHAPSLTQAALDLMAAGTKAGTVQGEVAPISQDGLTAAVSYSADVSGWFEDGDNDPLTFTMSGVTLVEPDGTEKTPDTLPGLSFDGTTLRYTPSAADEGRMVKLSITAGDGRFVSAPAPVELTVGEAPFSQPVFLDGNSGSFDLWENAQAHADLKTTFRPYRAALVAVKDEEGTVLTLGTDYQIQTGWENVEDETTPGEESGTGGLMNAVASGVIFSTDYLSGLETGDHPFTLHFGWEVPPTTAGGEPTYVEFDPNEAGYGAYSPLTYTVTVVDTTPQPPALSETTGTFDLYEGGTDHKALTVTFSTGTEGETALSKVLYGTTEVASGSYTVAVASDGTATLTLKAEYLSTLDVGEHVLTLTFANGTGTGYTVTVVDTTPQPPALSAAGGTFDLKEGGADHKALTVSFSTGTGGETALSKVLCGTTEVASGNYTVAVASDGTATLTLKADYLSTLDVGEHVLTLTFANGTSTSYTVTVVDTTAYAPALSETGGTFDLYDKSDDHKALAVTFSTGTNGETALTKVLAGTATVAAKNYTVTTAEGTATLTLKVDYLKTLAVGEHALTLVFANGASADYTVTVADTTPQPPVLSETAGTFDLYSKSDNYKTLSTSFSTGTDGETALAKLMEGKSEVAAKHYSVKEEDGTAVLTLKLDYLKGLSKGKHTLILVFANGASAAYTVTVKDSTPSEGGSGGGGGGGGGGGTSRPGSGGGGGGSAPAPSEPEPPKEPVVTSQEQEDGSQVVTVTNVPPEGAVIKVPVEESSAGMVAVLVGPDGTETVIRTSVIVDGELVTPLSGDGTLRIEDRSKHFDDMEEHWAKGNVDFVTARGLFNGMSEGVFAPELPMTRGMMATVLFRLDGERTAANARASFLDVEKGTWYHEGVTWAAERGIVNGYDGRSFAPDRKITREELATMVYRYAESLGLGFGEGESHPLDFTDTEQISSWAFTAVSWLSMKGILTGKPGGLVDPKGYATRAEVAAILERFVKVMAG